ncbi:MAG: PD40 domain-containing protein [Bacteroidetes bacterium]|nr:PD40 domain-containing protein [Bacteroidota bacterium]
MLLIIFISSCSPDLPLNEDCHFLIDEYTSKEYPENKYFRSRPFANPTNASEFGFIAEIDGVEGIWKYILATSQTQLIVTTDIWSKPDWSNSDWIVFESSAQIFKCKSNGDSLTQLSFKGQNYYPSWSPDGNFIIIVNDDNTPRRNFQIISNNGSVIQTLDSTLYSSQPAFWSPDGEKIAFAQANGDGTTQIAYININRPEQVIQLKSDLDKYFYGYLEWFPDSKSVLCKSGNNGIYKINIETGVYTEFEPDCPYYYYGFTILADGISFIEDRWLRKYDEETNTIYNYFDLIHKFPDGSEVIIPY